MTLMLSLENAAGEDTNIEIVPDETFESFLEKARVQLGYEIDISSIIGEREVAPTDNIYEYLNSLASMEVEEENKEGDVLQIEESDPSQTEDRVMEGLETIENGQQPNVLVATTIPEEELTQGEVSINILNDHASDSNVIQLSDGQLVNVEQQEQNDNQVNSDFNVAEIMSGQLGINQIFVMENGATVQVLGPPIPVTEDVPASEQTPDQKDVEFTNVEYLETEDEGENMEFEMLDPDFDEEKVLNEINELKQNILQRTSKKPKGNQGRRKKVSFSELTELQEEIAKDKSADSMPEINEKPVKDDAEIYTQRELLDLLEDTDEDLKKKSAEKEKQKEKVESQIFNTVSEEASDNEEIFNTLDEEEMEKLKKEVKQPNLIISKLTPSEVEKLTSSAEYLRFYLTFQSKSIQKNHVQFGDMSKYLPSRYEDVDNDGIFDYDDEDENSLLTFAAKKPKIVKDETDIDKENVEKTVAGINRLLSGNKKRGRSSKNQFSTSGSKKKIELYEYDNTIKAELNGDDDDSDYVPGQEVDWTKRRTPIKGFYSCRFCEELIPNITNVLQHAQTHRLAGGDSVPCIICTSDYASCSRLQRHIKMDHANDIVKPKSPTRKSIGRPLGRKTTKTPGTAKTPSSKKSKKNQFIGPKSLTQTVQVDVDTEDDDVIMLEEWLDEDEEIAFIERMKEKSKLQSLNSVAESAPFVSNDIVKVENIEPSVQTNTYTETNQIPIETNETVIKNKEVEQLAIPISSAPIEPFKIEILLPSQYTMSSDNSVQISNSIPHESLVTIQNLMSSGSPISIEGFIPENGNMILTENISNTPIQIEIPVSTSESSTPLEIANVEEPYVLTENHVVMHSLPSLDPLPLEESTASLENGASSVLDSNNSVSQIDKSEASLPHSQETSEPSEDARKESSEETL